MIMNNQTIAEFSKCLDQLDWSPAHVQASIRAAMAKASWLDIQKEYALEEINNRIGSYSDYTLVILLQTWRGVNDQIFSQDALEAA